MVLSVCGQAGHPMARPGGVWAGRIQEIDGSRVVMSVRTGGGAVMLLQAQASDIRQRQTGAWEIVLPMAHRLVEDAGA